MRSKKAAKNIAVNLILQMVTIISGFIVPRYIIVNFGSDINGVIASIAQFLGFISLMEAGVGGVVCASLYKSLVDNDISKISSVLKATEQFFKKIAYIFLVFSIFVAFLFPYLVKSDFDYWFTFSLVIIIGISTFVQYYFGITYQLLLQADQKKYVAASVQIITIILNTILVVALIRMGAGIHAVKLVSTAVFLVRPLFYNVYVKKHYQIDTNCQPDNMALSQKWDALGHHIAYFLYGHTDIIVLTIFTSVGSVSVYSVYLLVIRGLENLITVVTAGVEAGFGNMIAKGEKKTLYRNFNTYEFICYMMSSILFTTAGIMIQSFISIYTKGITDENYYRPIFAIIILLAECIYCIRLPYHNIVKAAGHFKQTRNGAFLEAAVNIILSIVLVQFYGLVGVVIGTLCATIVRTIQYIVYVSNNVIQRSVLQALKKFIIMSLSSIISIILIFSLGLDLYMDNYVSWVLNAGIVFSIILIIHIISAFIFYRIEIREIISLIRRVTSNRNS